MGGLFSPARFVCLPRPLAFSCVLGSDGGGPPEGAEEVARLALEDRGPACIKQYITVCAGKLCDKDQRQVKLTTGELTSPPSFKTHGAKRLVIQGPSPAHTNYLSKAFHGTIPLIYNSG